jgi:hypothetical protein
MPMIPGAPPAAPAGPQFPSLDPSLLAGALGPVAQLQAADLQALQQQQDQTVNGVLQMMKQMPNPAAQAATVEPGGPPTSPLAEPANQSMGSGGY